MVWINQKRRRQRLRWMFAGVLGGGLWLGGCETIKPYEKEYLLDPVMSDERSQGLLPSLMGAASSRFEKLASGSGGAPGTSCPTCGG